MKKLLIVFLTGLTCFLSGCGNSSTPSENQVELMLTETPKEIINESQSDEEMVISQEDTTSVEEFIDFAFIDTVTKEEMGIIKIPSKFILNKAKVTEELKSTKAFICAQESLHSDLLGFHTKISDLKNSLNCTAASFSTPDNFNFRMEIKRDTFNDFIWNIDGTLHMGECATEDSIVLQKISETKGWYEDEDGYHVITLFECGSADFIAKDFEKLKEVVDVMVQ